ncbi:MAG: CopL family metal-binding regulatory protein [Luteimonas sp.]|nr:CopL family metal-binding regulatory protein [Luteimonas sp.]
MSALLLRLLLCLSLMLNGIGTATANARMAAMDAHGAAGMAHPSQPAEPQPAEPQAAPADGGDCAHHPAEAAPPQPMPHDDDDCLQSCLAMCLHHCHAVPGLALSLVLPRFAQEPAQRELPERRTPPSPPPVRPPIA